MLVKDEISKNISPIWKKNKIQSSLFERNSNSNLIFEKATNINLLFQKHKFLIPNNFNEKGSKNFLASKKEALSKINLNEELIFSSSIKKKSKNKKKIKKFKSYNMKKDEKYRKQYKAILNHLYNNSKINDEDDDEIQIIDNLDNGKLKLNKENKKFSSNKMLIPKVNSITKSQKDNINLKVKSMFKFSHSIKKKMSKENIDISIITDNMSITRDKTPNNNVENILISEQKVKKITSNNKDIMKDTEEVNKDKSLDKESLLNLLSILST